MQKLHSNSLHCKQEASTLLPPMNYLKWLEKVDRKALSSLNIQNTQNDKKIRDGLMNHRNVSVLDSIVNVSGEILFYPNLF